MNRYLFELLRRIDEGARRLAITVTSSGGTRLRDITLVHVERWKTIIGETELTPSKERSKIRSERV